MRMPTYVLAIGFLTLLCSGSLFAQYYGERVLEKSFEQTEFFFKPHHVIPFGIGAFKSSTPGLVDDPLTNLSLNPANLPADSLYHSYFYVDFRSAREVEENSYYVSPYDYRIASVADMIYYPRFYVNTRKELEPVFSGALFARPLYAVVPKLFVGFSYQAISQDDKYYTIPQDIYRSVMGYDYAGTKTEASSDIPIVDRYSGTDNIHQVGHFLTAFSGYDIFSNLQVGLKLGRVTFKRDGSYGSTNLWSYYQQNNYTSLWSNVESREQEYNHWDLAAGLNYKPHEAVRVGVTLGRLWGDATQGLTRSDSSLYGNGQINVGTNWSYYMRSGLTSQTWDHQGNSWYGNFNFTSRLTPSQSWSLYYFYGTQTVDIGLGSTVYDTSYSNYCYQSTGYLSMSQGESRLSDIRSGTGKTTTALHRFFLTFHWRLETRMNLDIGFLYETQDSHIKTTEAVFADRYSRYDATYQSPSSQNEYHSYSGITEDKTLNWDFDASITTYQIPIIFTWKASSYLEFLFGLNRKISSWDVADVTLAVFNYREQRSLSETKRTESFGERYTQPREIVTDVQTGALGGFTVSPSPSFAIRFLVVPNFVDSYDGTRFQNLQWWIGLNLFP